MTHNLDEGIPKNKVFQPGKQNLSSKFSTISNHINNMFRSTKRLQWIHD